MEPLTSCERVNRMMERRDHDRIPRHESFWAETITRWQGEGLEGDTSAVPPQVSWEAYQFLIDCVKRHGSYGD